MSQKPVPIILIGKGEDIGRGVIQALMPDYEVVAYIDTREASIAEIPSILAGKAPPDPSTALGSGNLSDRPVAIVVGGYFTEGFDNLRDAVEDACGPSGSGLVWLKNDTRRPGPGPFTPEYPGTVAERVKEVMGGLMEGGKVRHVEGSVHHY